MSINYITRDDPSGYELINFGLVELGDVEKVVIENPEANTQAVQFTLVTEGYKPLIEAAAIGHSIPTLLKKSTIADLERAYERSFRRNQAQASHKLNPGEVYVAVGRDNPMIQYVENQRAELEAAGLIVTVELHTP